jgi:phenylpropionate dioxygenase-like ring-hydroxylating dioxygenase large terminal subunit
VIQQLRANADPWPKVPDVDLAPLRPYWYPVAYSRDFADQPISVVVLGEPVVLFRGDQGVSAFRDLCPHRGAKISRGRLAGGRIVCPYHGFQFDAEGVCRLVPAQPPDLQRIPSRLRLHCYEAAERYGIVWVALEEPRLPLPAFSQFDDPDFHAHQSSYTERWNASAARWMENFLDITHLPHVHPGILGDPERPVCDPYEVRETPTGLVYEFVVLQQYDPERWPTEENNGAIDVSPAPTRAELFFPFTVSFTVDGSSGRWVTFRAGLPVDANEVAIFTVQARNYMQTILPISPPSRTGW